MSTESGAREAGSAEPLEVAERSLGRLIEAGHHGEALERALHLWREKPLARLAALVTDLAALAGTPELRTLDGVFVQGNSIASRTKLEAFLAVQPADPRVFEHLVRFL